MTSEQVGEASKKAKRRGRPKGSKNKKKRGTGKIGRPPGSKRKETTFKANQGSLEETIKQLLKLPTNAEAKVRLIEAALNI